MLRSILIGLDGSAHSSAAVELGIRWARRFDAVLTGLGIVDEPAIRKREPVPIGGSYFKHERDQQLMEDAHRRVEGFLAQFTERCAAAGVACKVLEDTGSPLTQIMDESRLYDLTILGQQTFFHFETQDQADETLRQTLRQSSRPVVTVPAQPLEGTCVLVAYDGSPAADRALQSFLALGLAGQEEVHVASIGDQSGDAARLSEQAAEFLSLHRVNATAHALPYTSSAHEAILSEVRARQAHLLVMGAYSRSMWREWLLGSTTNRILAASPIPLFMCH